MYAHLEVYIRPDYTAHAQVVDKNADGTLLLEYPRLNHFYQVTTDREYPYNIGDYVTIHVKGDRVVIKGVWDNSFLYFLYPASGLIFFSIPALDKIKPTRIVEFHFKPKHHYHEMQAISTYTPTRKDSHSWYSRTVVGRS